MKAASPKIVFLGTPEFAVPTLQALVENNLAPFLVITQPDKPAGRKKELTPPPVKVRAEQLGIPVAQPATKAELRKLFESIDVDLCVLVAFGMIIPQDVLDKPRLGFLNFHPSALPHYRGPAPVQAALLAGATQTAITIMKLTAEMDAGPIALQQTIDILPTERADQLRTRLAQAGAGCMVSVVVDVLAGRATFSEQNHAAATYCKMLKRLDGQINWNTPAESVVNQFRAFFPWPGVFTHMSGNRLKIKDLKRYGGLIEQPVVPGEVFLGAAEEVLVGCAQGAIELLRVQFEGRNEITAQEFARHQAVGRVFER